MKRILSILVLVVFCAVASAQDKELMSQYQQQLRELFANVMSAPTDNERYNANELAVQTFSDALNVPNSFKWEWDLGRYVSVLTSPDGKIRVITWPVVSDYGEYECFGFMQVYDEKVKDYVVYCLQDKSDELFNLEESLFTTDHWLGVVYQQLIQTKYEDRTFYTLLGWTGVNNLVQRKVIEPVCFRGSSSRPIFGQALFRRQTNNRRIVLDYSRNAMVNLNYSEQYTREVERKRVKSGKGKNARMMTIKENHDKIEPMIIFDEIGPQIPGMEGLFQYYVPTGVEKAYIFVNGRWELNDNAQGRVPNERLNQDFNAPKPKTAPAYQFIPRSDVPAKPESPTLSEEE